MSKREMRRVEGDEDGYLTPEEDAEIQELIRLADELNPLTNPLYIKVLELKEENKKLKFAMLDLACGYSTLTRVQRSIDEVQEEMKCRGLEPISKELLLEWSTTYE